MLSALENLREAGTALGKAGRDAPAARRRACARWPAARPERDVPGQVASLVNLEVGLLFLLPGGSGCRAAVHNGQGWFPDLEEFVMSEAVVAVPDYVAGTWDIDVQHSHVGFVARHLMVSKVRGSFLKFEGQIHTAENPLESTATATIEMGSFSSGSEMRDNDVKGENFLDVARHPAMTYRSTSVRPGGDGYIVTGDLTIKGVTHPVELSVELNGFGPDPYGGTRAGISATGEINRNDYGITANMVLPTGGVVVSEKIQLVIEIEATLRTS